MTHLLDSNTCIGYLNGRAVGVREQLSARPREDIAVCSIVKAELFAGAMRSTDPERALIRQRAFLNRYVSLPFDDAAADVFAQIRAQVFRVGTPIGPFDIQIAAIALANNLTLMTHNTREFARIEGLSLDDWE